MTQPPGMRCNAAPSGGCSLTVDDGEAIATSIPMSERETPKPSPSPPQRSDAPPQDGDAPTGIAICLIPPTRRLLLALIWGALCHGTFLLGVGAMVIGMGFGMTLGQGPLTGAWGWVVNGLLLLQFPVLHSLLLSGKGQQALHRLAPWGTGRTLATTTYVTIAGAQLLLLFGLWSPSGTVWWQAQGGLLWLWLAAYSSAWALLGKAMLDAGLSVQAGWLGWTALLRNHRPQFPPMPTRGLFRVIRQPIYATFALTLWTVPVWTPDQLFVASSLTLYCLIGPLFKERRFARLFGSAFEHYRARTPYWVPWSRPKSDDRIP